MSRSSFLGAAFSDFCQLTFILRFLDAASQNNTAVIHLQPTDILPEPNVVGFHYHACCVPVCSAAGGHAITRLGQGAE